MLLNKKRSAFFNEKGYFFTLTYLLQQKRYGVTFRYKITQKIKITENASKFIVHAKQVTRGNFMGEKMF